MKRPTYQSRNFSEQPGEVRLRIMRLNAVTVIRTDGKMTPEEKRKAIALLLGRRGALTERELERLDRKLSLKRVQE